MKTILITGPNLGEIEKLRGLRVPKGRCFIDVALTAARFIKFPKYESSAYSSLGVLGCPLDGNWEWEKCQQVESANGF